MSFPSGMPLGRSLLFSTALALCTPYLIAPAGAAVTVEYGDPDRFTDAGDRNSDPVEVMKEVAAHLRALGDRYLPGRDLRIEVLDLDRAGKPYMNLPGEMRVMTGRSDPPCIDLRYSFPAPGQGSETRRERICDTTYLRRLEPRYSEHDPLVYEKRMLDEWFRQRFGQATAGTH